MQHLASSSQVLRVAVDGGDEAGVYAWKLAAEGLLVLVILIGSHRCLVRLKRFELFGVVGHGELRVVIKSESLG